MAAYRHLITVLLIGLLLCLAPLAVEADNPNVKWERIVGVINPPTVVGGISSVGIPWTAERGRAQVNLRNGRVSFDVEGLVLAGSPPALAVIGTTGIVTMVQGAIVCNTLSTPTVTMTPAVALSAQGSADFHGAVSLPALCDNPAFLLVVQDTTQGMGAPIVGQWIAHGAVRRP